MFIFCLTSSEKCFVLSSVGSVQVLSYHMVKEIDQISNIKPSVYLDMKAIFDELMKDMKQIEKLGSKVGEYYSCSSTNIAGNCIFVTSRNGNVLLSMNLPKILSEPLMLETLVVTEVNILVKSLSQRKTKYFERFENSTTTAKRISSSNSSSNKHFLSWLRSHKGGCSTIWNETRRQFYEKEYEMILTPILGFAIKKKNSLIDDKSRKSILVESLYKIVQLFLISISSDFTSSKKLKNLKMHRTQILRRAFYLFRKIIRMISSMESDPILLNALVGWIENIVTKALMNPDQINMKFLVGFLNSSIQIICSVELPNSTSYMHLLQPLINSTNRIAQNGVTWRRILPAFKSIHSLMLRKFEKDQFVPNQNVIYFIQEILQAYGEPLMSKVRVQRADKDMKRMSKRRVVYNYLQGNQRKAIHLWKKDISRVLQKENSSNRANEISNRLLFIAQLLSSTKNCDDLMKVFYWVRSKTSNDKKLKELDKSVLIQAIRKYLAMPHAIPSYFSVNQDHNKTLDLKESEICWLQLALIEIKLLLSSGKFEEVSPLLASRNGTWKWRLMFSWIQDRLKNDLTLHLQIQNILMTLHDVKFSQLPPDIVQQVSDLITFFPVSELCIKDFLRDCLNTIHYQVNEIKFLEHEPSVQPKANKKPLNELISLTLIFTSAVKQSYNQRQIAIGKSLSPILEMAYETCENVDYLLNLKRKIISSFDLSCVASRSAITLKLEEGLELIKEIRQFFPNMWKEDLFQLILSTVEHEFLPTIETAGHIIHHYHDLSSIPKFRIQLNQLLNMKWNKIPLSNIPVDDRFTTETRITTHTLCDYVLQHVPNAPLDNPIKPTPRKGFDKLCQEFIYSSLENNHDFTQNVDDWLRSSSEFSLKIDERSKKDIETKDAIDVRVSQKL